jgi:uncharacterized protein DUF6919
VSAAPFRRPPMVDIPWGERERWWTRTTRRLADRPLWGEAESLADLGELVAQFCEGRLLETPGHGGPRDPETVQIAAPLAHANRQGFVTTGSQPGHDHGGWEQRAVVEGWATPATVGKLRGLVAGTRLQMQATAERPWRSDHNRVVTCSRHHTPDGIWEHTGFGFVPGRFEPFIDLGRSDLTEDACYVTVYDPQWGDESLLWDRLSQPDWDNPAPPPAPSAAEVRDAERRADGLAWSGASAAEIDAADDETERLHQACKRPDLAELRRGRWYDTHPITSTGTTGGAGMSSIEEVRAGAMAAIERANEGLGSTQHAHASLEEAQGLFMRAIEGSGRHEAAEAAGLLAQSIASLDEVRQQVAAAISTAETFAGGL